MVTAAPDAIVPDADAAVAQRTAPTEWWEHVGILLLLVTWAVPLTRGVGGRSPHQLLVYNIVALVVLGVLRAWRGSLRTALLAGAVALAALVVCATSSTGWWGSDVAAGYVAAAATFVAVRRYARSVNRRRLVLCGVALAALSQFADAFMPWWGGRDPAQQMTGTFYWHNPYAAFLLPGALLGIGLVAEGRRPWGLAGWVAAPASVAGIVFSTSRATLAVLLVGWFLTAVLSVTSRRAAGRVAALTGVTLAVVLLLPGPPLFPHWKSPLAATSVRTAGGGQTLEQNGYYRTEFWREAVDVAAHHPIDGAGFHSLATASALYTPVGWARSQLAHNGYLQPLSDGGLLLGVPFLIGAALVGWRSLRTIARSVPGRRRLPDVVTAAAAVATLAAMAHSAVDFDWSHPAVLVEVAVLGACVCAASDPSRREPVGERRPLSLTALTIAPLAVALVLSALALHGWQRSAAAANSTLSPSTRLQAAGAAFGDFRPAVSVLQTALGSPQRVTDAEAQRALTLTERAAEADIHLALLRDAVLAQRGAGGAATTAANRLLGRVHGPHAPYVLDLAQVLSAAADRPGAARLLVDDLQRQLESGAAPDAAAEVAMLATVDAPGSYACHLAEFTPLLARPGTDVPAPTTACPSPSAGGH